MLTECNNSLVVSNNYQGTLTGGQTDWLYVNESSSAIYYPAPNVTITNFVPPLDFLPKESIPMLQVKVKDKTHLVVSRTGVVIAICEDYESAVDEGEEYTRKNDEKCFILKVAAVVKPDSKEVKVSEVK